MDEKSKWSELTDLVCETFRELLTHPDPEIRIEAARTIMELKIDMMVRL